MGKSIEVVAAVIRREDRIFATERGYGEWKDWWEFPGGKMEPGETPEAALLREIREELDADIRIGRLLRTVEWDYPAFHLVLHCFLCTLAGDSLVLKEHESARWLGPADLWSVKWLPADEELLPLLSAELLGIEPTLVEYIENQVIPQYPAFDKAHQEDHAHAVIVRALALAAHYPVDRNMVYAAAACHDIGLSGGRECHHLVSGEWIRATPSSPKRRRTTAPLPVMNPAPCTAGSSRKPTGSSSPKRSSAGPSSTALPITRNCRWKAIGSGRWTTSMRSMRKAGI